MALVAFRMLAPDLASSSLGCYGILRGCFAHAQCQRLYSGTFGARGRALHSAATASKLSSGDCEGVEREAAEGGSAALEVMKREWTPESRRTGVIAIKLGMTQLWNKEGFPIAVTVLQVVDNQVVMMRTNEKEGYSALQIGAVDHNKLKKMKKPVLGQFSKAGVTPKRKLSEFRVTKNALLPVGTPLVAAHFVPGQFVDVCSKSIGKGFQGVMKRHGMKGQPASHGVTKTHRKMGATGGGQDPGRIWPGKKMPGRMGGKRVTMKSLKVYRINLRFNALYVQGNVPGSRNTYVRVTDARRKPHTSPPPFPTYVPDPTSPISEESYSEDVHLLHEPTILFPNRTKEKDQRR